MARATQGRKSAARDGRGRAGQGIGEVRPSGCDRAMGALESLWLAAVMTVPIAVNPFSAARFDTEKALLLRGWGVMVALALAVYCVGALTARGGWRRVFPKGGLDVGTGAVLVLAGTLVLASVSAVWALAPGVAWFGATSRGGGVLTLLACAALFLAVATTCRRRVQVERLLLAIVVGSVLPTVVGLGQAAGYGILSSSGTFPEGRPWSVFGNAIALGSYLTGVIPVTAYQVWRARRWCRVLPALLLVAQGVLLFLTASRGPLIGLAAAGVVALLLAARRAGRRSAAAAGAVAAMVLLVVFLGGVQLVASSATVRQSGTMGMLTRYNTVEVRVLLYQALTARMLDRTALAVPGGEPDGAARWRPWIGYGPECLTEPLLSRLPARFEQVEGYDHIPDSTHSQLMDVLGGMGFVGLGLHLAMAAMLVRVARRALGLRLTPRGRWLCRGCFVATVGSGALLTVALWGAFAWALGVLVGIYVGMLLSLAVAVLSERGEAVVAAREWRGAAAMAVSPLLLGLWIEAQFGIPLVSSALLFSLGGGLLVALSKLQAEATPESTADDGDARGGWVTVGALAGCALLVGSLLDNAQGQTDAWSVLSRGFTSFPLWVLPVVASVVAVWGGGRANRSRWLLIGWAVVSAYWVLHAEGLAGLRVGPLRSVSEIVGWGERMQALAGWRLWPLALLPAALVGWPRWRLLGCVGLGIAGSIVVGVALWPEVRYDILLVTAQKTAELGEPQAAMQVFERTVGAEGSNSVHAVYQASQVRILAARAAKAVPAANASEVLAGWARATAWGERAVALRPFHAAYRGELGGVLEEAARRASDPAERQRLGHAAVRAYAAAVALAPGLNVHKRRLAGARLTLLDDAEGAYRVLEEMLISDPQNPVALSMLAQRAFRVGQAAGNDSDRADRYREAVMLGERCLLSPTITANHVEIAGTLQEMAEMRQWFADSGREVPSYSPPVLQARAYVPPKLPTPASRSVLQRVVERGAIAGLVALVLTPWMRRIARKVGFVDAPAARKVHVEPTPLLGGVAIALAVLCAGLVLPGRAWSDPLTAVLLVATGLSLVGVVDDGWPLPWWLKLVAQAVAATLLYHAGIRVQLEWLPPWMNFTITLCWLVGITNAVNFLDNMNGLSAGLSALAAVAIAILGVLNEGWEVAGVAAAVAGACAGFLRYNHQWSATIFMGDAGSLFLGSILASLALLLRFPANHNWVTWMCPVLLLAVPVFDMTHVCVARLRRGRNPFSTPGKDHTSHLLTRMGLPRHRAVLAIHAAVGLCGIAAGVVAYASALLAYAIAGAVFAFAVFLLLYFELRFGQGGTDPVGG